MVMKKSTPASVTAIPAGTLHITADVAQLIVDGQLDITPYLRRHLVDDWGDLSPREQLDNQYAIINGGEISSAYQISESLSLLIASEWDRSVTTLMLDHTCNGSCEPSDDLLNRMGSVSPSLDSATHSRHTREAANTEESPGFEDIFG